MNPSYQPKLIRGVLRCAKRPRDQGPSRVEDPSPQSLLAEGQETDVAAPVAALPAQVEVPLAGDTAEAGHAAVAVGAHPDRAQRHDRELALQIAVLRPEGQEVLDGRDLIALIPDPLAGRLALDRLVEAEEVEVDRDFTLAHDREVLRLDVVVLVVVAARRDHLGQGLLIRHHDRKLRLDELIGLLQEGLEHVHVDEAVLHHTHEVGELAEGRIRLRVHMNLLVFGLLVIAETCRHLAAASLIHQTSQKPILGRFTFCLSQSVSTLNLG